MEPTAVMSFPNGVTWNIVVNGNTYGMYGRQLFPEDLSEITIKGYDIFGGEVNSILHNVKVVDSAQLDDNHFWFGLVEQF